MIIKVLGSAAGGGFPQFNCNCRNCADVRAGRPGLRARTQSSLAVSRDGERWVLLNASPDLRQQIAATPELAPRAEAGSRSSPIVAVVLTNGDVDHIAGLLSLREGSAFTLYASTRVLAALAANSIFNVLASRPCRASPCRSTSAIEVAGGLDRRGLRRARQGRALPGGAPARLRHARGRHHRPQGQRPGHRRGLLLHPGLRRGGCRPGRAPQGRPLVLFDGTLFTDDEMIAQGLSDKTGSRMGHISMSGPQGSIAAFAALDVERRIYVHINNSNPVLRDDSPERAASRARRLGGRLRRHGDPPVTAPS